MLALIVAAPIAAEGADKSERALVLPKGWAPDHDAVVEGLQQQLENANSQAEMNRLSRQIADVRDAQLFVLYVRLFERLGPSDREELVEAQAAWLKKRDKHAEDSIESEGGSLAPMESNLAAAEFTLQRITQLTKRLRVPRRR